MTQALQQPTTPELVPAKITLEQYHQMIDAGILDDCSVELISGIIVEMSPEGTPHAHRSTTTGEYLTGDCKLRSSLTLLKKEGTSKAPF